jgi:DNA-binding SARP family transcriptional activator
MQETAGNVERALVVMEQVLQLDPDTESAAAAAIRLLLKLGHRDEARLRARHLIARLNNLGVTPSAETRPLLDQLK